MDSLPFASRHGHITLLNIPNIIIFLIIGAISPREPRGRDPLFTLPGIKLTETALQEKRRSLTSRILAE